MHFSPLKITLLLIAGVASLSIADPQLVMSTVSPDEISARISQLESLRQNESLSSSEKKQLDNLWKSATAIEQMNERCGSISLTEELDEDCERFYKYELPRFETEFFNVTGEIRLSPTRLSNTIEQRRSAIKQCYDALQIEAFRPSRYLSLEGNYSAEPLSHGIEISYDFTLETNSEALQLLRNRMEQWNSVCGSIVLHSDHSGNLAPLFLDLIQESEYKADDANGSLYFKLGSNYSNRPYIAAELEVQ